MVNTSHTPRVRSVAVFFVILLPGSAAAEGNLVFHRVDGSVIAFAGDTRAWCDSSALHVATQARRSQSHWTLTVARRDVRRANVVRFTWRRPNGIELFVYDGKTGNEASEGAEGSTGRVSIQKGSCRLGRALELSVAGLIASEFSDGKAVRVSGHIRGHVTSPPRR